MSIPRVLVAALGGFLLGSAQAIQLGEHVDLSRGAAAALRSTGLCTELGCSNAMLVKIDTTTTYLGTRDIGVFTYLVNGRLAMAGWMGRPRGDLKTPTLTEFNRLARAVAGTSLPQAWLKSVDDGFDGTPRLDAMKAPRVNGPAVTFGATGGDRGWYTLYAAQRRLEPRLRALINRAEPRNAARIARQFVHDMGGPLSGRPHTCAGSSLPLMSSVLMDNKSYDAMNRYFTSRGLSESGCCGGPARWTLPGLSGSSVAVDARAADGSDNPDVCVTAG